MSLGQVFVNQPVQRPRRKSLSRSPLPLRMTYAGRHEAGFSSEKGDCTVRALAAGANLPYDIAHSIMKASGRRDRKGHSFQSGAEVAEKQGLIKVKFTNACEFVNDVQRGARYQLYGTRSSLPTFAQVANRLPKQGRFVVRIKQHVFAVVDGIVYDSAITGPRKRVTTVAEITPLHNMANEAIAPLVSAQRYFDPKHCTFTAVKPVPEFSPSELVEAMKRLDKVEVAL